MSRNPRLQCAIYTRKSTEEGLEQDFKSLDAQYEACSSFIASQASLGWRLIPQRFDDGGISGGTMDRPALQSLLDEITAGRIDVVVVYKIDRLTRSLMDFSKIVDIFDAHDVSFVSVTQQFNTTTSMGRLTLNVLLSFAQFEREVTAERIRDKIAASKKKGMWMGGPVPLGYDVENRRLVVNKREAETVGQIFRLYLETGSVRRLKEQTDTLGITTKVRQSKDGCKHGGKPFARGNLYRLLTNPIYRGRMAHRGKTYPGNHDAIVPEDLWDEVQNLIASNTGERTSSQNVKSTHILTGLIFDETGDRLSPTHAIKNGRRYRYYISARLMRARRIQSDGWRLSADEIEKPILAMMQEKLSDQKKFVELVNYTGSSAHAISKAADAATKLSTILDQADPFEKKRILADIVQRLELYPDRMIIDINVPKLLGLLSEIAELTDLNRESDSEVARITLMHRMKKRGVETKLVLNDIGSRSANPDPALIQAIAKSHLWRKELTSGKTASIQDLAKFHNEDAAEVSRFLPLAWLAPDIVQKILNGKQPVDLTLERIRRMPVLPISWNEQRKILGFQG
ncbi:MAG: recombinase family protein [Hyphomicrobiales bacterium]|nr:recombinase family protein [Hyphomicrobiales bacterium]